MQSGAATLVSSEDQVLEFEDQLQQIQLLVNLKQVADPLLGYAETAPVITLSGLLRHWRSWKVYLSTIRCWSPVHIMNWQKNSLVERAERF